MPTAATSVATTTATTDPLTVPEVIDEAYVDRVLAALDAALGDVFRLYIREGEVTPEIRDRLAALYRQPLPYDLVVFNLESSFGATTVVPGDRATTVTRLITASGSCIYAEVLRDFRPVGLSDLHDDRQWVGLGPAPTPVVGLGSNPTPWIMTVDGFEEDRTQPPNPCK